MCGKTQIRCGLILFLLSLSGVCRAQGIPNPVEALENRLTEIYESANPSVVGIRVEIPRETWISSLGRKTQRISRLGENSGLASEQGGSSILEKITRSLPGNQAISPEDLMPAPVERHGTGLIYDLKGDILTTYEVVRDVTGGVSIVVVSSYDTELPAELRAVDPYTNIAVLRCPQIEGKPAKFADGPPSETDPLRPGSFVFCISRPYGLPNSAYYGIVCGTGRQVGQVRYERLIQTTIPLYPGSHGAPLLDLDGAVVGILSSTLKQEGWESVSFAIPADQVREIADKLIEYGTVARGFLGVRVANASELHRIKAPRFKKLYGKSGAVVTHVVPDSPAAKAGIQDTDLIVGIGGKPIRNWEDLVWVMHGLEPGTDVPVVLERDDQTIETKVAVDYLPSHMD